MFLRATQAAPPALAAGGHRPRRHIPQPLAPLAAPPACAPAAASLPPPPVADGSDAAPRRLCAAALTPPPGACCKNSSGGEARRRRRLRMAGGQRRGGGAEGGGGRPTAADHRAADGGQLDLCQSGVGGHGPHRRAADRIDASHLQGAQGGELSAFIDTPLAATIAAAGAWQKRGGRETAAARTPAPRLTACWCVTSRSVRVPPGGATP